MHRCSAIINALCSQANVKSLASGSSAWSLAAELKQLTCCNSSSAVAAAAFSTRADADAPESGPGSRSRSLEQAEASGQLSSTAGPQSAPARSPDAPADPAQLSGNRGSDPEEVLRSSAWQAQQAMGSSYDRPDQGGASFIQHAPGMAGKLAEKVAGAAHIAAQAAVGAASAMSNTVKAATGAAVSGSQGPRDTTDQGGAAMTGQDSSSNIEPGNRDASPVSDRSAPWNHQAGSDKSSNTADLHDTADGAERGVYQQAADRLMDIEGLPHKDSTGDRT